MQDWSAALCKTRIRNHIKTTLRIELISYAYQWSLSANINFLSYKDFLSCKKYIGGSKSKSRSLHTLSIICFPSLCGGQLY